MTFGHFLVTRFNVSVPFGGGVNLDAGWLQHRQALFERVCLPAVTGQSTRAFRWLLLCDARTPEPHRSRLEGYEQASKAEIVRVDDDVQGGLLGAVAARLGDGTHVKCRRIQCDEIWSFVYAKSKNVPAEHAGEWGYGDVWTWVAIDADTKLVPSWAVGRRDGFTAAAFIRDLADRLAGRVQLTTDGLKVYLEAVEGAFGNDIDYAMLVKTYEGDSGKRASAERRYSPAVCTGAVQQRITGNPDAAHISTSYIERQNLTMRMSIRRFTRLTNAFSKKVDNHKAAQALYFMHYNFARIHKTLRVTPAMEAGISDHVWSAEEIARLAE